MNSTNNNIKYTTKYKEKRIAYFLLQLIINNSNNNNGKNYFLNLNYLI